MRHLLAIVAVIFAVTGNGWAQNRGSARYAPPDNFDGEITRAPRLTPTRGAAVRRQRPTKAPEPAAEEDGVRAYQPQDIPTRTTARRVPQRISSQQVPPPPLPIEDTASRYSSSVEELPQVPPISPEGRPQGARRRRPKKRRKPEAEVSDVGAQQGTQLVNAPGEEKTPISELLHDDKKRNNEFQGNTQSRHASSSYDPGQDFHPEKNTWDNNPSAENQANAAGPQYFRPQPATNRLPVDDAEQIGNSRGYLESSPNVDSSAPYVPKRPQSPVSNEASYVPILPPIRVPSEGGSRLPPEDFPSIRDKETSRPTHLVDTSAPHRGHSNRPPASVPDEIIQNSGAKPLHNIIPQPDEPVAPARGHSEVRLPQEEQPLISEYVPPSFDSEDLIEPNAKGSEEARESPNTSHRLPNPSEIHYDSVYPEFSDRPTHGSQRVAGRRQEPVEPVARNSLPSYSSPRRDTGTKPQEYDNDAQVDRGQASQYRPPIQRGGSRYKPEDVEGSSRSRTEDYPPTTNIPRTRGSTRYQAPEEEYVPEKTRSSTRSRSEPNVDSPSRTRSSSTSHSTTGTRGSQRYVPDTRVNDGPRTSSRRQPINGDPPQRNSPTARYVPIDEIIKEPPRSQSRSSNKPSRSSVNDGQPEDSFPVRNTQRSPENVAIRTDGENSPSSRYVPTDEIIKEPQRSQSQSSIPSNKPSRYSINDGQPDDSFPVRNTQRSPANVAIRTDADPEDSFPVRNTLRSRPQYEVRDAETAHTYAESAEDPDVYNTEYKAPQRTPTRTRTNERNSVPRQQPPLPEYEVPQNRQQYRPESQYVPPQNPRSRTPNHQTEHEVPQYPRPDSRQANNRQGQPSSRQQGRSRQNPEPSAAPRKSSGGSNFVCPDSFGFFADPVQCDKYYECRNGTAEMNLCSDGLAFNEISAPKFLRCDSLRDVDCKSRPELQEPQSSKNCPRRFGLFPHETDCTKFWNCVDGAATEVQCPPGLTYNDERATCDWADLVETSCKTEDLLGFTCPEPTAHDLADGVYSRYPHPSNCQLHFTCIKGADGLRRPRMLSCNEGLVFDPATATCTRPEEVPGCEDFYGDRRPAPKRKPAREPAPREPEEEFVEEPTPKPRRRGTNRRARN